MVRPEPFRAMIEQALASSEAAPEEARAPAERITARPPPLPSAKPASSSSSSKAPAPNPPGGRAEALERRLDQLSLVGATPARGMRVPLHVNAPFDYASPSAPIEAPPFSTDALPPSPADFVAPTKKLELPAALDAIIQDALASFEMTKEMPPQSLPTPKDRATTVRPPPKLAAMPELKLDRETVRETVAKPAPVPLPSPPRGVPRPTLPPPLPKRAIPAAHTAPAPRVVQFLDENTIPGVAPVTSSAWSSSSSSSERRDAYRLHLEFEDTPARPLPALASLLPMPVETIDLPPLVDPEKLGGVESTDLHRLDELEGIEDLDLLAQALGLRSVADVSIPSDEGEPVSDLFPAHDSLPPRRFHDEGASAVRRAAVMKALGDDDGIAEPSTPGMRPKLAAAGAVTPVIVKIPTRPKVSAHARAQARSLYLTAVEAIGRGDKVNAIGHLKLAIHYDDGVELYRDLLVQLERTTKSGEAVVSDDELDETPALMVVRRRSRRQQRPSEVSRGR